MNHPEITELFIYFRNTRRALDIVRDKKIFCPEAASFNDPFDCAIPFDVDYNPEEYVASLIRTRRADGLSWPEIRDVIDGELENDASLTPATQSRIDQTAKMFYDHNQSLGVLCLSEDPDSVLMWSHYGGKHAGLCLGFSREATNRLGDDDACAPIIYTDIYPEVRFSQLYSASGDITLALLYTKAREWAYEREWRMLSDRGNALAPIPGAVSRIILGCNAPTDLVDECRVEAVNAGVTLEQAEKVPGKFALTSAPLV